MARNTLSPFGGYRSSDPFLLLHRDMNRLFDDVLRGRGAGQGQSPGGGDLVDPRMNVSETEKELRVTAELPGVRDGDVEITLHDDLLTIRGEKKFEQERGGEKENFHFVERSYGAFQRSLRLPYSINPDEVRADFRDGVLTITVPKTAQQQRSHKIPIAQGGQRTQALGSLEEGNGRGDSRPAPEGSSEPGDQQIAH